MRSATTARPSSLSAPGGLARASAKAQRARTDGFDVVDHARGHGRENGGLEGLAAKAEGRETAARSPADLRVTALEGMPQGGKAGLAPNPPQVPKHVTPCLGIALGGEGSEEGGLGVAGGTVLEGRDAQGGGTPHAGLRITQGPAQEGEGPHIVEPPQSLDGCSTEGRIP